jgi:hypothetical protein
MITLIINKILYVLLFISILNVIRRGYFLVQSLINTEKYKLSDIDLILVGTSIAFILTCIFTGITF